MRQSHRVLFGEDPLADVTIEREHLRLQLERELKGHLLALRERYLLTGGNPRRVAELLTSSVAGFLVLFRAACGSFKKTCRGRSSSASAAGRPTFLSIRSPCGDRRSEAPAAQARELDPQSLFESYLTTIERVAEAVDRRLHP